MPFGVSFWATVGWPKGEGEGVPAVGLPLGAGTGTGTVDTEGLLVVVVLPPPVSPEIKSQPVTLRPKATAISKV